MLDLIIYSHNVVKNSDIAISKDLSPEFSKCDHYCLSFTLNTHVNYTDDKKQICFRNIKKMDMDLFKEDMSAEVCRLNELSNNNEPNFKFESLINNFNSSLSSVLDKHAPLLTKTIIYVIDQMPNGLTQNM